jgi:hypothetical protein
MRAVLSCAGAYVSGAAGSNECPAGSVRIEAEPACRTAAIAAGKSAGSSEYPFVETDPTSPRGCYYDNNNIAWFNTHAVGTGLSTYQLLCATTGAPLTRRRRTDGGAEKVVSNGVLEKGYSKRVLKNRYSDQGYSTRVLKHGVTKGALEKGYSTRVLKRGTQKGCSRGNRKGVLNSLGHNGAMAYYVVWQYEPGTHGALTQRVPSPAAPAGGCCAPLLSTRACAPALRVGCDDGTVGTVEYSPGTHSVLTRYSQGTHEYSHGTAHPAVLVAGPRHAVQRMCAAPPRVLLGA